MVIESSIMNPGQSLSLCCWDKDPGGATEFCVKQPRIYSTFESVTFIKGAGWILQRQRIFLTSSDLTSACFHDERFYLSERDRNVEFATASTSARCDTQNPGVTESLSPQEKQGRWFVEGPRGASVPWKQVAQHHTAAYLQGIFVDIQEIHKNKTFPSKRKQASPTVKYSEVINSAPDICP